MVRADFAFADEEKAIAGTELAAVSIRIERTGEVTQEGVTEGVIRIFRHFDPSSGIGAIDYISPHRTFPSQQIKSFNTEILSLDQQRREWIEFQKPNYDYAKFRNLKHYLISEELEDLSRFNETGTRRDSLALLREIFAEFFGPKVLLG